MSGLTPHAPSHAPPVIVLVHDHPRAWEGLAASRAGRFCHRFSTEVERFRVRIASAFTMRDRAPTASPCRDLDQTVAYVRALGEQCLGVLFASQGYDNFLKNHTSPRENALCRRQG